MRGHFRVTLDGLGKKRDYSLSRFGQMIVKSDAALLLFFFLIVVYLQNTYYSYKKLILKLKERI